MPRLWVRVAYVAVWSCLVGCGTKPEPEPAPSSAPAPAPSPDPAPEPGVPQPSAAEPVADEKKPSDEAEKKQEATGDEKPTAAREKKPSEVADKKSTAEKKREEPAVAKPSESSDSKPAAAAAEASKPTAAATVAGPCGEKGQTRCPLQAWMEDHLQAAVDKGDAPALAKSLSRVASLVPDPSWNAGDQGWSKLANAGLDAAKKGDIDATKASCKSCHKAWRSKYKQQFRLRVITD